MSAMTPSLNHPFGTQVVSYGSYQLSLGFCRFFSSFHKLADKSVARLCNWLLWLLVAVGQQGPLLRRVALSGGAAARAEAVAACALPRAFGHKSRSRHV